MRRWRETRSAGKFPGVTRATTQMPMLRSMPGVTAVRATLGSTQPCASCVPRATCTTSLATQSHASSHAGTSGSRGRRGRASSTSSSSTRTGPSTTVTGCGSHARASSTSTSVAILRWPLARSTTPTALTSAHTYQSLPHSLQSTSMNLGKHPSQTRRRRAAVWESNIPSQLCSTILCQRRTWARWQRHTKCTRRVARQPPLLAVRRAAVQALPRPHHPRQSVREQNRRVHNRPRLLNRRARTARTPSASPRTTAGAGTPRPLLVRSS
mmetsp:Transcript_21032/g.66086  ORF Transcript_21032/g.66086 Transcript_21032/m.66086 type:complete len:268 (+) Transcript_21032:987-1790(+)